METLKLQVSTVVQSLLHVSWTVMANNKKKRELTIRPVARKDFALWAIDQSEGSNCFSITQLV